jgi:hypothetical protein
MFVMHEKCDTQPSESGGCTLLGCINNAGPMQSVAGCLDLLHDMFGISMDGESCDLFNDQNFGPKQLGDSYGFGEC